MMKKSLPVIFLVVLLSNLRVDVIPVKADAGDCFVGSLMNSNGRELEYPSGVTVSVEQFEPTNPVVVGQDPDEVGVSILVEVTSLYGAIEHEDWVTDKKGRGRTWIARLRISALIPNPSPNLHWEKGVLSPLPAAVPKIKNHKFQGDWSG
jgi:hypothetical protein